MSKAQADRSFPQFTAGDILEVRVVSTAYTLWHLGTRSHQNACLVILCSNGVSITLMLLMSNGSVMHLFTAATQLAACFILHRVMCAYYIICHYWLGCCTHRRSLRMSVRSMFTVGSALHVTTRAFEQPSSYTMFSLKLVGLFSISPSTCLT